MPTSVALKSPKFPVGTVVKAYPANGAHTGRATGTLTAEATVDATGTLTLTGLTNGELYVLWAEVAGANVSVLAGADDFTERAAFLLERRAALRAAVEA